MMTHADTALRPDRGLSHKQIVLDIAERAFIMAVFSNFAYRTLGHFIATADITSLMMVAAEALPLFFILSRAPSPMSERPSDWLLGIAGTTAPLLVAPASGYPPLLPLVICLAPMMGGIYLQVAAKLMLGRSFGVVAANRGVRTKGPYRVIRHPMYAGYTLTHLGILLAMPSPRNAVLYGLAFGLQLWRITREERVLLADPAYRDMAARVPYRLLPKVY